MRKESNRPFDFDSNIVHQRMLRRPASNGPVQESVQQLLARCAREARSPPPEAPQGALPPSCRSQLQRPRAFSFMEKTQFLQKLR